MVPFRRTGQNLLAYIGQFAPQMVWYMSPQTQLAGCASGIVWLSAAVVPAEAFQVTGRITLP